VKSLTNRKAQAGDYLPGVSWRDVLRGSPVTREEVDRVRKHRRPAKWLCWECGGSARQARKGRLVRCPTCGAIMDPASPAKK
jgi:tRNA(Ile2) C34 agmatinyltransferase TiaS